MLRRAAWMGAILVGARLGFSGVLAALGHSKHAYRPFLPAFQAYLALL